METTQKEFKCEACGKVCKSEHTLKMHMAACKQLEKKDNEIVEKEETDLQSTPEVSLLDNAEQEVEKFSGKQPEFHIDEPADFNLPAPTSTIEALDLNDEKHYPTGSDLANKPIAEIMDEIIDLYTRLNGIIPRDSVTRAKLFRLYNEYFDIHQRDCSDCQFEDIYDALKRLYMSH